MLASPTDALARLGECIEADRDNKVRPALDGIRDKIRTTISYPFTVAARDAACLLLLLKLLGARPADWTGLDLRPHAEGRALAPRAAEVPPRSLRPCLPRST